MEFSSPLAAMQPPRCAASWGLGRDLPASRPAFSRSRTFGANSFNFRDLSMKKAAPDYFSTKPTRGSSPTASLAADLSQNMHIDQSPQLPTPRRSLFTSNLFQAPDGREGITTPSIQWERVTTPPIPSSSPGFAAEAMDISPLPHKAPHSFASEFNVQTPTPDPSPLEEDMLSAPSASATPSNPLLEAPRQVNLPDRRKPSLQRPSLARTKGFSTNTVSLKTKENQLPPFKFGAGNSNFPNTSSPSLLEECFQASPPQEKKAFSNPAVPPRPRQPLFNTTNILGRGNGSPLGGQIRKPTAPTTRPRKQFRRSLSMFEHPGDLIKQEKKEYVPSGLQAIMDVDDTHQLKLPHFIPSDEPEGLPRIEDSTMVNVLDGEFDHVFDQVIVVDCRFEYEYNGGHINGAINSCQKEGLAEKLFGNATASPNTLLIFHCEYSAHRAPKMAGFIRQRDRSVNEDQYPKLTYPEVYILDGGYSSFFESHQTRCFPQNYLRMDSKDHEEACERGMDKVRQRKTLSRAQTFAFGQSSCQMEDSPTAQGRGSSNSLLPFDLLPDSSPCMFDSPYVGRMHARRMASY